MAGNKITNLRQVMKDRGVKCNCIRCREAKDQPVKNFDLNILEYPYSDGTEYFISADSKDGKTLFGFCRLRIDKYSPVAPAIIRELHVYGELVMMGEKKMVQHSGLGTKLLLSAERLVAAAEINKLAIISGVGVRGYYKKFGYKLQGTYMVKNIVDKKTNK